MKVISTREAARRLGIHFTTLAQNIAAGKIPAPPMIKVGGLTIHVWTEEQIETVRKLLPKIANGRKTRYKKRSVVSNQQSAKAKRAKKKKQTNRRSKP